MSSELFVTVADRELFLRMYLSSMRVRMKPNAASGSDESFQNPKVSIDLIIVTPPSDVG